MKKQISILSILIFIFGLVPINYSLAITQNQISSEVQIVCTDGADNWFSGSGTIIDPKGIILTNRHVVEGAYKNICFIGFLESINQEPNFGPDSDPYLAEVKYITTAKDMDAAVLYLDNKSNKTFPYVNIWSSNSNSLKFGDKIEVVGYPGIGGSTITYTSGDFSGFGSQSDGTQNYVKTTALLEHGNSGGSAYNQRGEFVGIPSMVVTGSLNSISYVLSVDSIKKWLSGFLGGDYKQEIIEQKPIIEDKPTASLSNDFTPPSLDKFALGYVFYNENSQVTGKSVWTDKNKNSRIEDHNKISFLWYENCSNKYCIKDNDNVKGYYYYFGTNPNATPKIDGKYIDSNSLTRENFGPLDEFGLYTDSQNIKYSARLPEIFSIEKSGSYYFILQAIDSSNNISNSLINYQYIFEGEDFKQISSMEIYDKNKKLLGTIEYPADYYDINHGVVMGYGKPEEQLNVIYTNQTELLLKPIYKYQTNNITYLATKNKFCEQSRCENGIISNDGVIKWNKNFNLLFFKPTSISNAFTIKHNALTVIYKSGQKNKIVKDQKAGFEVTEGASGVKSKLLGKIILQVENHGEAWYVNPATGKRYYMANGDEAFKIMRSFGIGIKSVDLGIIKANKNYAKKYSGKIYLQVESRGEAYYVDFDGNVHYLKNGAVAYDIMKNLGLGIKNSDLNKIPEGKL